MCPCSKDELALCVRFLYYGEIYSENDKDFIEIQDNLSKIFGFPENLNLLISDFTKNSDNTSVKDQNSPLNTNTDFWAEMETTLSTISESPDLNNTNEETTLENENLSLENEIEGETISKEAFENITEKSISENDLKRRVCG